MRLGIKDDRGYQSRNRCGLLGFDEARIFPQAAVYHAGTMPLEDLHVFGRTVLLARSYC